LKPEEHELRSNSMASHSALYKETFTVLSDTISTKKKGGQKP